MALSCCCCLTPSALSSAVTALLMLSPMAVTFPQPKWRLPMLPAGRLQAGCGLQHVPQTLRGGVAGAYLFSQTVPQILLLARDSHSILLSYMRTALLSCFCRPRATRSERRHTAGPRKGSGNGASRPRGAGQYKGSTKSWRSLTQGRGAGRSHSASLRGTRGGGGACPKG